MENPVRMLDTEPDAATAQLPRQFSLLKLLLVVLAICVAVAVWSEQWRNRSLERRLEQEIIRLDQARTHNFELEHEIRRLRIDSGLENDDPPVLNVTGNPDQVHIKTMPPGAYSVVGAVPGLSWSWKVYLPADQRWWLYTSHGRTWDPSKFRQRYSSGAIGGFEVPSGMLEITATVMQDHGRQRWLEIWAGKRRYCTRLPPESIRLISAAGQPQIVVAGETEQESIYAARPYAASGRHIPLLRWHKAIENDAQEATSSSTSAINEYGFSLYLVDDSRQILRAPAMKPAAGGQGQK